MGHQVHPDDFAGGGVNLPFRLSQFDATTLASSAGMNLSLNHNRVSAKGSGNFHGLLRTEGDSTFRGGYIVLSEEFFGLIFVDFHRFGLRIQNSDNRNHLETSEFAFC
jgi:hypothetical protein